MTAYVGSENLLPRDPSELALWAAWGDSSDPRAREQLVLLHLPYARTVAARMFAARRGLGVEFADYYQLACVGLLEAMDRFDVQRGIPFRVFSLPRIEGSVLNGLQRLSELSEQLSLRRRIQRERTASLKGEGWASSRPPKRVVAELAEIAMGLAIGLMLEETAMYASETSESRQDTAYSTVAWRQARERVVASVRLLPERERQIIVLHYFHALAFDQIAVVFGLSKGRISQIHREALLRLRELLGPIDQFLLTR